MGVWGGCGGGDVWRGCVDMGGMRGNDSGLCQMLFLLILVDGWVALRAGGVRGVGWGYWLWAFWG